MISGLSASDRVVALLDGGVEGVAIDMADGQRVEFGVAQDARREAGRAAERVAGVRQAVAAERGHQGRIPLPDAAERGAGALDLGRIDALRAARRRSAAARCREKWSSTPARKSGSRAALRMSFGPTPVAARKPPRCSGSEARNASAATASACGRLAAGAVLAAAGFAAFHGQAANLSPASLAIRRQRVPQNRRELVTALNRRC